MIVSFVLCEMVHKQTSKYKCFYERLGEVSLSEEENYDDEKVEEEVEEERTDDDVEIDEFMRDLSIHLHQHKPERKMWSDSREFSIPDTTKIRKEIGSSKERANTTLWYLCSQCKANEKEIDCLCCQEVSAHSEDKSKGMKG